MTFEQAVAQTRRVRGHWSELAGPLAIFRTLPAPYCYVGAAEVTLRISYLEFPNYSPDGLRAGLQLAARALREDPLQPDALVIRTKLLAGYNHTVWLTLAEQTLRLLRLVAPTHRRLPDAEAALHIQRREWTQALMCLDRMIAAPPSAEEAFVAQATRALLLDMLGRPYEALAAYDAIVALDPNDPWTWNNRTRPLVALGRLDDALASVDRSLAIMDFSTAHTTREWIVSQRAKALGRPSVDPAT